MMKKMSVQAKKDRKRLLKHELDLNEWLDRFNVRHLVEGKSWARHLRLVHNKRLSHALGRACYGSRLIEISSRLLIESYEVQRECFIHEICHFISYFEYGQAGHGAAFHALMEEHYSPEHHRLRYCQSKLTTKKIYSEVQRRYVYTKVAACEPEANNNQ